MNLLNRFRHPAIAIAWEIWAQSRWKFKLAAALLVIQGLLNQILVPETLSAGTATHLSCVVVVAIIGLIFGSFHFTEGQRKGGFGSYPTRLFTMPRTTLWLVGVPMLFAVTVVGIGYSISVIVLFQPLAARPPLFWPVLYLVSGVTIFQGAVWVLARRPYLKLFTLSTFATFLGVGWLFLLPDILSGTLEAWEINVTPARFEQGLKVALSAVIAGAVGLSWYGVRQQRIGGYRLGMGWVRIGCWFEDLVIRRRSPFKSAGSAAFWFEWRHSGLVLPAAVSVLLVLTFIPTYLTRPHSEEETIATLIWMALTPFLLAMIIGRGFAKPDFWRSELRPVPFHSVRPLLPSKWVWVKLKVAALSVVLSWFIVLTTAFFWTAHAGNLAGLEPIWFYFQAYQRSPADRFVFVALGMVVVGLVTWRFMVSALASGLSGSRSWYYSANLVFLILLVAFVFLMIDQFDGDESKIEGYQIWPYVTHLPFVLGGYALVRFAAAWMVWERGVRRGLLSSKDLGAYYLFWVMATGLVMAMVCQAIAPGLLWLRYSGLLLALFVCPLVGPGLAILACHQNRTRRNS